MTVELIIRAANTQELRIQLEDLLGAYGGPVDHDVLGTFQSDLFGNNMHVDGDLTDEQLEAAMAVVDTVAGAVSDALEEAGIQAVEPEPEEEPEEEPKPKKRTRRTKAQIAADEALKTEAAKQEAEKQTESNGAGSGIEAQYPSPEKAYDAAIDLLLRIYEAGYANKEIEALPKKFGKHAAIEIEQSRGYELLTEAMRIEARFHAEHSTQH